MPSQPSKVLVEKAKLLEYIKDFEAVRELPVPELAKILKVKDPILKVKGATLDDHIKARELSSGPMIMLGELFNMMQKGESPDLAVLRKKLVNEGRHPKTNFELRIFHTCVVEPQFSMGEVVNLAEVMPGVVNRVVSFALGITGEKENGS